MKTEDPHFKLERQTHQLLACWSSSYPGNPWPLASCCPWQPVGVCDHSRWSGWDPRPSPPVSALWSCGHSVPSTSGHWSLWMASCGWCRSPCPASTWRPHHVRGARRPWRAWTHMSSSQSRYWDSDLCPPPSAFCKSGGGLHALPESRHWRPA